ncbi:hypothetical protein K443DRAFT_430444 [Laccaria amethystina LaAM-08-1]|uniref:Uncharacterized protein n=1 Tax=Laccaria amethystina LaAM-08-1 TaxID=1095629 RepID=A0A0C9WI87_9AGAR|nr:hypothetical protein K443DRAFT_430444 [Laccaria amethystina LaAM-08-1]
MVSLESAHRRAHFGSFFPGLEYTSSRSNQGIATGRKGVVVVLKMKKNIDQLDDESIYSLDFFALPLWSPVAKWYRPSSFTPPPPLLLLSTGVSISNSSSSQEGLSALQTSLFTSGQTFSCYPRVAEVACPSAFASHPYIGVWISYRQGGLSQCWARYAEVKHRVFRAPRSPVRTSLSLEATTCLRCLPISRDLL